MPAAASPWSADGESLESRRVSLRSITPDDYELLFGIETRSGPMRPWLWGEGQASRSDYLDILYDGVHLGMLCVDKAHDVPFGAVLAYQPDWAARTMWITAAAATAWRGSGKIVEAVAAFIEHCFGPLGVRTVYFEISEPQLAPLGSLTRLIAADNGRYVEHDHIDGRYHDRVILSIPRHRWSELEPRLRAIAGPTEAPSGPPAADLEQFCSWIEARLGRPEGSVRPQSRLREDLMIDSLETYVLVCSIEELAGWQIPEGLLPNMATLEDCHVYVTTRLAAEGRGHD